jgi:hypothetical protein
MRTIISNTKLRLILLSIGGLIVSVFGTAGSVRDWNDKQIKNAFDDVARNYGATEYATYTFMVEFQRAPKSLQELRDTGHLNVLMANPYTCSEVVSLERKDFPDGVLMGNIFVASRDEGHEVHEQAFFVRKNPVAVVRSMVKRIYLYTSSLDRSLFEQEGIQKDEQMTAVYCRQSLDALESFQQKIGSSPRDFEDMFRRGDVNVHYVNPITGNKARSRESLSAGDFYYRKIGDEGYMVIGWGRERPVFFACTDDAESKAFYERWPGLEETIDLESKESRRG